MRRFFLSVLLLAAPLSAEPFALTAAQNAQVEKLLASLSLREKIGQLNQLGWYNDERAADVDQGRVGSFLNVVGAAKVNALQRRSSKVPLLFGLDVIHGYASTFPIPLGEAASWEPALAERTAEAAAIEAKAAGVRWTFAPMVDIARDPRWGRAMEGAGEDPLLGAAFAAARVRGFQKQHRLAACVKHFVGYGAAEGGRDYNAVDLSERKLWEVYYPPFQAGLEAGAATLMSSFNTLNGVPLAADPAGLGGLLKGRWGFQGFIVSDWNSVGELVGHGVAADGEDAARQALGAGVDMDMVGGNYAAHLESLLQAGKVRRQDIDEAARRVLRVKAWLGLLEQPLSDEAEAARVTLSPAHRRLAREAAQKSLVLLKNDGVLPLPATLKSLALLGPLADSAEDYLGEWAAQGRPETVVTLAAALRARPGLRLLQAEGCSVSGTSRDGFAAALKAARAADAVVLALGEARGMSGEGNSRSDLGLPGVQRELLEAVLKAGKPTVLLLFNGRALTLQREQDLAPAILEAWLPGMEGGPAIAATLFGEAAPEGRLPVSFPRVLGQVPLYASVLPTARPGAEGRRYSSRYIDAPNTPLYPLGYGLTYTRFAYSDLQVPDSLAAGATLTVRVTLKNTGARAGVETAQLYLHDALAQVSRPSKELRAFEKVALAPGESRTLSFSLPPASLGYFDRSLDFGVEAGRFTVTVGPDAENGLTAGFTLAGSGFSPLPGQRPRLRQEQLSEAAAFEVEGPGQAAPSTEPVITGPTGPQP